MASLDASPIISRSNFASLKRILVKVGTSVVTHADGTAALGRVANIVEQIVDLHTDLANYCVVCWCVKRAGKEVIVVTSGAGALGRRRIRQAMNGNQTKSPSLQTFEEVPIDKRAAAAAGQSALMSMYEALFAQKQLACSQILLTDSHFILESGRSNLRAALNALIDLRIVPIINENDVTSIGGGVFSGENSFWDNDSMACLVCREMNVDLAIFLTDVEGLCRSPPNETTKPDVIHTFVPGVTENFKLGTASKVGRGGMQAKVDAAISTLKHTKGVVIASGFHHNTIARVLSGETIGTFFTTHAELLKSPVADNELTDSSNARLAANAKANSLLLQTLSSKDRANIITVIADSLWERRADILAANETDMSLAKANHVAPALQARLLLTEAKIQTLVNGIKQIAAAEEPIGKVVSRTELSEGLTLTKSTVPIGVLMVIFESRPDVLPQVASLAIRSGNGLILKGGKEASNSNKILHEIICTAIEKATAGIISSGLVALVQSREAISNLLQLDKYINLVIPRGSGELVKYIQSNTKIPVLGHADGICHLYVDKDAQLDKALAIALDSKTDYPAACNAAETLLIHKDWPQHNMEQLILAFKQAKVEMYGGPKAAAQFQLNLAKNFRTEYGALEMAVEIVDGVDEAIHHINQYSSSHTDAIVTEDQAVATKFLNQVDSACVFHNASTRFADGYRFGLGAEVGISTSRIHARGPVGIEGLMTTKWSLVSSDPAGSLVKDFSSGKKTFTHIKQQIE